MPVPMNVLRANTKPAKLRSTIYGFCSLVAMTVCTDALQAQSSVREPNSFRASSLFSARPFATLAGRSQNANSIGTSAVEILDDSYFEQYERQLNAILKTRRDEEIAFVKGVVDQIRAGNLTTRLVNTSFKWVRKKRPNVKNYFIYFERVLRILATNQGVGDAVPAFDIDIYSTRPATAIRGGNP